MATPALGKSRREKKKKKSLGPFLKSLIVFSPTFNQGAYRQNLAVNSMGPLHGLGPLAKFP